MSLITKDGYGQVEFNHVAAQRTGQIYAQLPTTATEFNGASEMVENGMLLTYDRVAGEVKKPSAVTDYVYLHKSAEKEYNQLNPGLKTFALAPASNVLPRLYKLNIGDTYTTNMIDETADVVAGDILVPATTGIMTKATDQGTGDDAKVQLRIEKITTMPDAQAAVKVEVVLA